MKYLAVIIEGNVSTDDDPIRRIMGPFNTYDEAWEAGDRFVEKFGRDIYNHFAEILETEAEAVADELHMEETRDDEEAHWNALNHPEGIIIETRME
jgi:hypothetical protein